MAAFIATQAELDHLRRKDQMDDDVIPLSVMTDEITRLQKENAAMRKSRDAAVSSAAYAEARVERLKVALEKLTREVLRDAGHLLAEGPMHKPHLAAAWDAGRAALWQLP